MDVAVLSGQQRHGNPLAEREVNLIMTDDLVTPVTTLQAILTEAVAVASDRKLQLFCCACCRRFWDRLSPRFRHLIELTESFCDGAASADAVRAIREIRTPQPGSLERACMWAAAIVEDWPEERLEGWRATLEYCITELLQKQTWDRSARSYPPGWERLIRNLCEAEVSTRRPAWPWLIRPFGRGEGSTGKADFRTSALAELRHQFAIAEDIFGKVLGPDSQAPFLSDSVQTRAIAIAATIYDRRQFSDLPTLADALEEAGYTQPSLLAHCRAPIEHVRGCWVLDLLLVKQ